MQIQRLVVGAEHERCPCLANDAALVFACVIPVARVSIHEASTHALEHSATDMARAYVAASRIAPQVSPIGESRRTRVSPIGVISLLFPRSKNILLKSFS